MATASSKIEEAVAVLHLVRKDLADRLQNTPPPAPLYTFLHLQEDRIHEALAALGE